MAKGKTNIIGLVPRWRKAKEHDAFRVAISSNGKFQWVSAKINPTLKQLNQYLEVNKLREATAEADNQFQALKNRLYQELQSEYGLKIQRAREKMDLVKKSFNFEDSVDQFYEYKNNTSIPSCYKSMMLRFWFPFFLGKGCQHPREFKDWRREAQHHLKTAKKLDSDERYSINSHSSMAVSLNEYMKFLKEYDYISDPDVFTLKMTLTLEQKKRGLTSQSRNPDTYSVEDLIDIKNKIDSQYSGDLLWKSRAYGLFFGVCTGIRRGNLLGLKAEDLQPQAKVPHFVTRDNIVAGWSRGQKGTITLEASTKTFIGQVTLPFIQPDSKTLVEVATFLKNNLPAKQYILGCYPNTVNKWWKKIASDCGFRFIHPHGWKHGYATRGAIHLHDWYNGNAYLLQTCCMHQKFETTQKYFNQKSENFLEAFEKKE